MTSKEVSQNIDAFREQQSRFEKYTLVGVLTTLLTAGGAVLEQGHSDKNTALLAAFTVLSALGTNMSNVSAHSYEAQANGLEAAQYVVNGPDPAWEPAHKGDRTCM